MNELDTLSNEILRYGTILTDDSWGEILIDGTVHFRIRTISYDGKIYYHKMEDGNVVEFKVIGKVE